MKRQSSAVGILSFRKNFLEINPALTPSPYALDTPLTKIVSTLGPATNTYETITKLIQAGVNVVRMNFSHGDYDSHTNIFKIVRKVAADLGKEVAIMCDLQGPKVRCNTFPDGHITLKRGDLVTVIHSSDPGKTGLITTKFGQMISHCKVGEPVLMDDGLMRMTVVEKKPDSLICKVDVGGELKDKKGINLPSTDLGPLPALTEKDIADAKFALEHFDNDFFALSFVRRPEDVVQLRDIIKSYKKETRIVVKIEKPQAVEALDSILAVSDAAMVARGDLAVEVGVSKIACLQKHIIRHCLEFGIPVITATQMMESMTHNPTPTRAESADVANAIFDGTDCVMTSGETASGEYPAETVAQMREIILQTEANIRETRVKSFKIGEFDPEKQKDSSGGTKGFSVGLAAHLLADTTDAVAFGCVSDTGNAAIRLSTSRPMKPLYVFSNSVATVRRMCMTRGAYGIQVEKVPPAEVIFHEMEEHLKKLGAVKKGDNVVYTAGLPTLARSTTNTVHVKTVE